MRRILKVFEAFAGYGSQRMALRNLGIEHEVVAISEFDKYADASYQAIHGETWNMGDITKIDVDDVPDHDLFTYSFPCQDISVAGKGKGFSKDSGTRSGLLWESERIIKAKKPKYLLMENVKNLISEKFMPGFVEWILALEELGYSNYYEVLNAKDFGIPQNRERVFMVSILGEHEPYVFPKPIKLEKRLKDVLEDEVDEKYYLSEELQRRFEFDFNDKNEIKTIGSTDPDREIQQRAIVYDTKGIVGALTASDYKQPKQIGKITGWAREDMSRVYSKKGTSPTLTTMEGGNRQPKIAIKNNTDQGYLIAKDGDGVDLAYPTSNTRRGRVQESMSQTLTTDDSKGVVEQYRIRKLTPLECFRLMDVSDEDFYKAQAVNSNTQLYKQAGNSIVVSVLEAIFRNMFLEVPEEDLIGEHIPLF